MVVLMESFFMLDHIRIGVSWPLVRMKNLQRVRWLCHPFLWVHFLGHGFPTILQWLRNRSLKTFECCIIAVAPFEMGLCESLALLMQISKWETFSKLFLPHLQSSMWFWESGTASWFDSAGDNCLWFWGFFRELKAFWNLILPGYSPSSCRPMQRCAPSRTKWEANALPYSPSTRMKSTFWWGMDYTFTNGMIFLTWIYIWIKN